MLAETLSILRQRRYYGPKPPSRLRCLCLCQCGRKFFAWRAHLVTGNTKSCGCLRASRLGVPVTKMSQPYSSKNHSLHWVYNRWAGMWGRCEYVQHKNYHRYGGRGIKVCERWRSFECFLEDMGVPPSRKHTLERNNNDLGYSPDNCRWATLVEQAANRSNSKKNRVGPPKPTRAQRARQQILEGWPQVQSAPHGGPTA